jgi:hypothetical protein
MGKVDWTKFLERQHAPLEEWLMKQPSRYEHTKPRGAGERWRASSLATLCARQEALCSIHDIHREQEIDINLLLIFALGTGIHDAVQQRFLADILIGGWRCRGCSKPYGSQEELMARPKICDGMVWNTETQELERCPNHNYHEDVVSDWHLPGFEYREITIRQEEPFYIESHPDGFLWRGKGSPPDRVSPLHDNVELLEVKSISDSKFMWGTGDQTCGARIDPIHKHVVQIQTYLHIMGMERGRIMYINKTGYGILSSIATHPVQYSESFYNLWVRDQMKSFEDALAAGDPSVAPRVCESSSCYKSKDCPVSKLCWAMDS